MPVVNRKIIRGVAKIFCILITCFFILYYRYDVHRSKKYFGKWKVEKLMRNGKIICDNAWQKDSLAWKNIYFEECAEIYFCPNPNRCVDSISILMKYIYNKSKNTLKVVSFEKSSKNPDTIPIKIKQHDKRSMQWNMIFYQVTIAMQLKKYFVIKGFKYIIVV